MLMPSARRWTPAARASNRWTVSRGVCSGLSVFRDPPDPAMPRLPAAGRELPAASGSFRWAPIRASASECKDGIALHRLTPQIHQLFTQRMEEGIGRPRQRLHPEQVSIDRRRPGSRFPRKRRRPVGALVGRHGLPVPSLLQLGGGMRRHPQPRDELLRCQVSAKQTANSAQGHGKGRILSALLRRMAAVSARARKLSDPTSGARTASLQPCSKTHRLASRFPLSTVETYRGDSGSSVVVLYQLRRCPS